MPEISLFYGIRVIMYYDDHNPHNPPHFHAEYNGNRVIVEIEGARVIKGAFPSRQLFCQDHRLSRWLALPL